jgi:leucyl-tRNA synthetase
MKKYNPQKIERKWQKIWEQKKIFNVKINPKKQKEYILVEFPYPSGDGLHVGHCRSYTGLDIISRKKRMEEKNVLFPIGWDAFGLPTENYAIKKGIHPSVATKRNTDTFRKQLKSLGFSFDWSREINTTEAPYYKWTQWIFLQLFKHNLAYKDKIAINWCPSCKIGLANEEVVAGNCERCGTKVEKREKDQWMIKITKYADRLIKDLDNVNYLEKIKIQQKEWIGRSEGVNLKNKIKDLDIEFEVYDSIPQTFMAQTFTVIAPDHPLLKKLVEGTSFEKPVLEFARKIVENRQQEKYDDKTMDGIFTGRYVGNYCGTGRDLPIWVASYVVTDYGTGIVNCSAHDERDFSFAKKYNIPLKPVLFPKDEELAQKVKNLEIFYREPEGLLQEPIEFKGLTWEEARKPIIEYIVKNGFGKIAVHYKLRDWVFSRQHYWGEPIPLVFCEECGWVPVAEKDLPVELPKIKKYQPTDTGESPLSAISKWVNVACSECGGSARRETDTMPNWAGSNWYFLAYTFAKNGKFNWNNKDIESFMPVDWYNGGMEHTTLHLLYSRFIFKFLWDIGAVPKSIGSEPYMKRTSHGMVLGEGGIKMSKSKGNVINPDQVVKDFGADTLRIYEMFMGPFDQAIPWDTKGVIGSRRFLERIYNLISNFKFQISNLKGKTEIKIQNSELDAILHKTIKKVSEDIEAMRFNTAVSALMILINAFTEKQENLTKDNIKNLLLILSPFAPHLAEELWEVMKFKGMACQQAWPKFDEKLIVSEKVLLIVQVNGKVRDKIEANSGLLQADAEKLVNESEKIKVHLEGKQIRKIIYIKDKLINIVI